MRPLLLDKSTTRRGAAVLTRSLTFSSVGSKSSHHQVRGVTRIIRQTPMVVHTTTMRSSMSAPKHSAATFVEVGFLFSVGKRARHSCRRTLRARATMRAAGGCRGRHGGAARCGIQSSQCHVGLSLPRSQRQFGRRPHRTHGHAAVALPWVVLRGALLHGQAREAPRRTVLVPRRTILERIRRRVNPAEQQNMERVLDTPRSRQGRAGAARLRRWQDHVTATSLWPPKPCRRAEKTYHDPPRNVALA